MIPVKCILRTIDRYEGEDWPTQLAVRPLIGDLVRPKSGNLLLKVINVIHITVVKKNSSGLSYKEVPGLEVHLGVDLGT